MMQWTPELWAKYRSLHRRNRDVLGLVRAGKKCCDGLPLFSRSRDIPGLERLEKNQSDDIVLMFAFMTWVELEAKMIKMAEQWEYTLHFHVGNFEDDGPLLPSVFFCNTNPGEIMSAYPPIDAKTPTARRLMRSFKRLGLDRHTSLAEFYFSDGSGSSTLFDFLLPCSPFKVRWAAGGG